MFKALCDLTPTSFSSFIPQHFLDVCSASVPLNKFQLPQQILLHAHPCLWTCRLLSQELTLFYTSLEQPVLSRHNSHTSPPPESLFWLPLSRLVPCLCLQSLQTSPVLTPTKLLYGHSFSYLSPLGSHTVISHKLYPTSMCLLFLPKQCFKITL